MKRYVSMFLAVIMLMVLLPMSASADAQEMPALSVSNLQGNPGEQIKVTVAIKNNSGFGGMAYDVCYDNSVLKLVSYELGIGAGICTDSGIDTYPNKMNFQYAGTSNVTGDGALVSLVFEIITATPCTTSIQAIPEEGTTFYYEGRKEIDFSLGMAVGTVTVTKPVCNHIWDDGKVTTPAGCETAGVKTYTCTVSGCGETETEAIPATGHSFGAWKVTKAATCTEKGVETRECTCGAKETRDIAATGHKFGEWKVTKAATCAEKGEETRNCACGAKETREIAATGQHKYGEWKVTKAATCTEKGIETRECTCGAKENRDIAATGHKFGEWKVTKAATCTEKGIETRECTCGAKETRDIAATGHKFGEWKVTKAATCTEKGIETRECTCGAKETRDIAATGHKYGEWKVTKVATCTEKGVETRECNCGAKETRDIAATGHKFGEWKETKAATCTEKGEETRECACGEKELREVAVKEHVVNSYGKDDTHHWALCDDCDYVGKKEAHSYDYNGVCVCGAKKPVVVDPDLDDVPKTGDITPYIAMMLVVFLSAVAYAAFSLKRRAAK